MRNSSSSPIPFLIGVAGGASAGKARVCQAIVNSLGQNKLDTTNRQVAIIPLHSFYFPPNPDNQVLVTKGLYDFDHPSAFDFKAIKAALDDIIAGKSISIPIYDRASQQIVENQSLFIGKPDVVLVEGILAFYNEEIRNKLHLKLFVDTDADIRLSQRVIVDVEERHLTLDNVLTRYSKFIKPSFDEFVLPTKKYADVIIPRGPENSVAVSLIVKHIQELLSNNRRKSLPLVLGNDSILNKDCSVPSADFHNGSHSSERLNGFQDSQNGVRVNNTD